jgi:hypothetical protein
MFYDRWQKNISTGKLFAWNMPNVDNMGANMSYSELIPAHLKFGAKCRNWLSSVNTAISDTLFVSVTNGSHAQFLLWKLIQLCHLPVSVTNESRAE